MDVSYGPDLINQTIAFGPDILQLIQLELETRKITYAQIADKAHTATGTVASWICRGTIPMDKLWPVIAAIGSPSLWMKTLARIPGNIFCIAYPDNFDDHPMVALDEAIENAELFLRQAREAKAIYRHKKAGHQFAGEDLETIEALEDSIADSLLSQKLFLIRNEDHYGRLVNAVMYRKNRRMKDLGYTKEKTALLKAAR